MRATKSQKMFNLKRTCSALLFTLVVSIAFFSNAEVDKKVIKIGVFADQLPFLGQITQQQTCPEATNNRFGENQMLLEYLIICNLLTAHTQDLLIEFVGYPVVPRIVAALAAGEIDISGFGVWKKESGSHPEVELSPPLLASGQFNKGLYVTSKPKEPIKNTPARIPGQLVAVSNRNWTYDWQMLNCEFEQVLHVDKYEQMFQILAAGRADVLPLAFGKNKDMVRNEFGVTVYPLPGIKLSFSDSTHVLVSAKSKAVKLLKAAVEEGLTRLRQSGQLESLYVEVGVINPQTENWRALCKR